MLIFDKFMVYVVDGEIYEGEKFEIKICFWSFNVFINFEEKD